MANEAQPKTYPEPTTHISVPKAPSAEKKVVSIAVKTQPEKIRVELNIEKWPAIWQPSKANAKAKPTLRTFEREVEREDQTKEVSKLLVGFTELGTLTTEDQKMFYALIRQWEKSGKPASRPIYFSDRLLAKLLNKKGWGTNVITALTGSLRRLRMTPLRWVRSFHQNDGTGRAYEEEVPFNLLSDLKIITRRGDGHITNQQGYFQFDKHIEANLLNNYTKPLLDEEFFKIEGEIAQLIYTHIDLVMFGKTKYERCSKDLFRDLGLDGASYRFKSNRRQKLEKALRELQGMRLNHGVIKSATIQETKDGEDYKAVFIKTARVEELEEQLLPAPEVVINHYGATKDVLHSQAEQLVQHFQKVFHGVDDHSPQSKETAQALSLISQHGFEQSKFVIEFARTAAESTGFKMQHFGGVLSYASRAIAQKEKEQHAREESEKALQRQARQFQKEEEDRMLGERRLASLTPEQYQARHDRAKQELFKQHPFMAQQREGSAIHEGAIRRLMIRELENEPMDLLVTDERGS